jgi:hypothetical protein
VIKTTYSQRYQKPSVLDAHNALLSAYNILKDCIPTNAADRLHYLQTIEKVEDALSYFDANVFDEWNDNQ